MWQWSSQRGIVARSSPEPYIQTSTAIRTDPKPPGATFLRDLDSKAVTQNSECDQVGPGHQQPLDSHTVTPAKGRDTTQCGEVRNSGFCD